MRIQRHHVVLSIAFLGWAFLMARYAFDSLSCTLDLFR